MDRAQFSSQTKDNCTAVTTEDNTGKKEMVEQQLSIAKKSYIHDRLEVVSSILCTRDNFLPDCQDRQVHSAMIKVES